MEQTMPIRLLPIDTRPCTIELVEPFHNNRPSFTVGDVAVRLVISEHLPRTIIEKRIWVMRYDDIGVGEPSDGSYE